MSRNTVTTRWYELLDSKIFPMFIMATFFGWIVMKDISLPGPVIIFLGIMGLGGLMMLGVQNPRIPLYAMTVYLPFSRVLVGDFGTEAFAFNLTNILMVWIFVAFALKPVEGDEPRYRSTPVNKMILFFMFLSSVSLLKGGFTHGSWYITQYIVELKRWLTPMFCYFLAFWVIRDKKTIRSIVAIIMFVLFIASVMAIRDYAWATGGSSLEQSRIGGIMEQSNTLAAFFVYYMFYYPAFFTMFPKKGWPLILPFLVIFRAIMVTFSRGAYLGFAAGCYVGAWFRSKVLFALLILFTLFAYYNPWVIPSGVRYRMGMTQVQSSSPYVPEDVTETLEASSARRIDIWRGAIEMSKDHPWWGVGYGGFPRYIGFYSDATFLQNVDPHNAYLLIATEMGIPTLLIFMILLFMGWHYGHWLWKKGKDPTLRAIGLGYVAGMGGLYIVNIFGSRMDTQQVAGYFWILLALLMRAVLIEREGEGKGPARTKQVKRVTF